MTKKTDELSELAKLVKVVMENKNIKVSFFNDEGYFAVEVEPINNRYGRMTRLDDEDYLLEQQVTAMVKSARRTIEKSFTGNV